MTAAEGGEEFPRVFAQEARVDYVDIYRPARLDGSVPIEETIGAIAEMVTVGCVRHVGYPRSASRQSAVPPQYTPFAIFK